MMPRAYGVAYDDVSVRRRFLSPTHPSPPPGLAFVNNDIFTMVMARRYRCFEQQARAQDEDARFIHIIRGFHYVCQSERGLGTGEDW